MNYSQAAADFAKIEKAIHYLENRFPDQPSLGELANAANLSEFHFQRVFSRWVGISPKRFLQFLTKEYAKGVLENSQNLLSATFDAGFSSPSRLHDLFISCEAVTPGEFKKQGKGIIIRYGIHPTPFGNCLLAATERGICNLIFLMESNEANAISELQSHWKNAILQKDVEGTAQFVAQIFQPSEKYFDKPLHLVLKGTNFQIKVWEALLKIPPGKMLAYNDIANMIGNPKAVRAVASAVANNPLAFIIPCHRVIRKMGIIHKYRWGAERKKAMIGWEAAKCSIMQEHIG